ncbi:MAG: hypothetical protein PWP30_1131 [Eubacteriaceae bacterium]|jgi:hypothetical protein|nr:hypothetical protein [Eubacteriaceae bacterium]MDK2937573.1 hypothetical protein [Eubacteriaceae bacterium]
MAFYKEPCLMVPAFAVNAGQKHNRFFDRHLSKTIGEFWIGDRALDDFNKTG